MSDSLIVQAQTRFPGGGGQLQILLAIAEFANEQGSCYVTLEELAGAARMTRQGAWRIVRALREDRWIVTSRVLGQNGTLIYQINLPKLRRSERPNHDSSHTPIQPPADDHAFVTAVANVNERVALRPACHPE